MKKTAALILIILNILSVCAFASSASYDKLQAFGIIDSSELKTDFVTRKELAKYAVRLSGLEAENFVNKIPFKDVSENDKYYDFIAAAYGLKFMSGTSEDKFSPDEKITAEQAAKVILSILGYGKLAEAKGGYPQGYMVVASDTGLFKNVSISGEMKAGSFVEMLYNAAEISLMKTDRIENGNITMKSFKNENVLSEFFDIYSAKGIISGNKYTGLFAAKSEAGDNEVVIGSEKYNLDNITALDMIGHNTEIYYREEDNERTILYIEKTDEEKTVDARDIVSLTSKEIKYTEGEKEITKKFPANVQCLVNGKLSEFICPSNGKVTLIDNNDDGNYEVVKISSYRTFTIGYTGADKIIDIRSDSFVSLDNKEADIIICKNGNMVSASNISVGNVMLAEESEGEGKNIKILRISDTVINGKITAVNEDKIKIGAKEYFASKFVLDNVSVGTEGNFYADYFGEICDYDGIKAKVYGYLNKIHKDETDNIEVRIFTENNRWVTLKFKDKVKHNGKSKKDVKLYEELTAAEDYRQLIQYRVNSDRQIYELNTAQTFEQMSDEEDIAIKNSTFRLSYENAGITFRGANTFEASVYVAPSTIIFRVPVQAVGEWASEEKFSIEDRDILVDGRSYNVKAYNMDRGFTAEVCVVFGDTTQINTTTKFAKFMIIKNVMETVNDDNEETYLMNGYYGGTEFSIFTEDKNVLNKIGTLYKSDIIQFAMNNKGYATSVNRVYESQKGSEQKYVTNGIYSAPTIFAAQVKYNDAIGGRIIIEYGKEKLGLANFDAVETVYIYNPETGRLKMGSRNDVLKGDYVFGIMRYLSLRELIVIRK